MELAWPPDFIPVPPGWEARSLFVADVETLSFYHFDRYAQALAKVERGHAQDLADVREMLARGMVTAERALEYFERLAHDLYRYPALSETVFRRAVEATFGGPGL